MSSPIIFFVIIIVIDLILKSNKNKKKYEENSSRRVDPSGDRARPAEEDRRSGRTLRDLREMMEEEFQKLDGDRKDLSTRQVKPDNVESRDFDTPQKREDRARQTRDLAIEKQRAKVNEHSELEKSRRLTKERMFASSRLSDSQVPLAGQDPKRRMDDYDLGERKRLSIEVEAKAARDKSAGSHKFFNMEEDLIKAVVYSEILGKPKSIKK